jgi:hypothetical protein
MILMAMLRRRGGAYFLYAVTGTICWFFTTQASRYLLPVLPAWYVVAALGFHDLVNSSRFSVWLRKCFAGFWIVCLLFLFGVMVRHFRYDFLLLSGQWSQDQFLTNLERTWPIAKWMNTNLPQNARIFNVEEVRPFYFDRTTVRERNFNFFTDYARDRTPGEVRDYLKGRGFSHILIHDPHGDGLPVPGDDRLRKIYDIVHAPEMTDFVVKVRSQNIRDAKYDYYLYEFL